MQWFLGFLLACCAAEQAARAQDGRAGLSVVREPRASDIVVPADLGDVIERHQPQATAFRPIIIHIQEAHTNYEAQKRLAEILERLVQQCGLRLILVEGGEGDVGLAYLRSYGPPESRREVAERYLKAGVLSGEEYFDIVSEHPLILWGVERQDLYQDNVQAFLDAESLRDAFKPMLALVRESAERMTPPLFELNEKARRFERGAFSPAEYADALVELATQQRMPAQASQTLSRFLSVRALEGTIEPAQVEAEQAALMERLTHEIPPAALERLLAAAQRVREGGLTREAFYRDLEELAAASAIPLSSYPALARYVRYVEERAMVVPAKPTQEMERVASAIRQRLMAAPDARAQRVILEELDLVEKLLELKLSPAEYRRLQGIRPEEIVARWTRVLNEPLTRHGLRPASFNRLTALAAAIPRLERFYDAAQRRDTVLVDRAIAKLAETHEPLAVLITGGFHSPRVTQLLKERGVGIVVVAPKISAAGDERLYHAVLKYKSGHGGFEDVQAAVGR